MEVKFKNGKVHLAVCRNRFSCGVGDIGDVNIKLYKGRKLKDLYDELLVFLNSRGTDGYRGSLSFGMFDDSSYELSVRAVYVMSDRVREAGTPSLYDFCKYAGMLEGRVYHNYNSGNNIQVFEFSPTGQVEP